MKRSAKVALTLTYDQWVQVLRLLTRAIEGRPAGERASEGAMELAHSAPVKDQLRDQLAGKVSERGGITP